MLAAVVLSALVVSIDISVLSVAIPTVMRDFHTDLASLQWVLTGYSLVFASLLIIGGRLGDLHGHRTMFVIGGLLFGVGSLLAALSWSVPSLFVGEALIEGVGASLMMPATLALISITFQGRERAAAFATWGAVMGIGAAVGPLLGGFFTSELSWRFAFGVNVLIAPATAVAVFVLVRRVPRAAHRPRLDGVGAALIASGMFLLVFAISQGGRYGWWAPRQPLTVVGAAVWPADASVSPIPFAFVLAVVLLTAFVVVERRKELAGRDPLFEFAALRHRGFRYGLITNLLLSLGQLSLIVLLAVYLQNACRLDALETGLWLVPMGLAIVLGSRLGVIATHRVGATTTVRLGLALELVGLTGLLVLIAPDMTFWALLASVGTYGVGMGIASSQLTNVIMSDVEPSKSGIASGTNSTLRQVGAALGIAIVSTIITTLTVRHTAANIRAARVPAGIAERSIAELHTAGATFTPPARATVDEAATLMRALADGLTSAARPAILYMMATMLAGLLLSFLIPRVGPVPETTGLEHTLETLESLEAVEALEPSREVVLGPSMAEDAHR